MKNVTILLSVWASLVSAGCEQEKECGCEEGSQRCSGSVAERCVVGCFEAQEDCHDSHAGCVRDAVSGAASCLTLCQGDEARCFEDVRQVCNDGDWDVVVDCTKEGKYCEKAPESTEPNCADPPSCMDEYRCDGDIAQYCRFDRWIRSEDCAAQRKHCRINEATGVAFCV